VQTQPAEKEGRIAFTSHMAGEHKICFRTSHNQANRDLRLDVDVQQGEHAIDYDELAKMEHLTAIEVEVRKLGDRVKGIRAEQSYQRQREAEFRDLTESTNSRVLWWSIGQTTLLVVAGVYQVLRMKKYFKSVKKLS
jgi:p24 family protein alpha